MPMDPGTAIMLGAGVQAAGALAGGAVSGHSARKIARMQMNQQQQFAQHGLRWRVEDAKRAGVHPLYALGAQLPSFTPIHVESGDMGEGISRAAGALGAGIERYANYDPNDRYYKNEVARIGSTLLSEQLRGQRLTNTESEARSALLNAEEMEARSRTALNLYNINKEWTAGYGMAADGAKAVLPEVMLGKPGDSSMQRGPPDVAWKQFDMGGGYIMDWPSGQQPGLQSAMEGVEGFFPMVMVIARNVEKHGVEWVSRALEQQDRLVQDSWSRAKAWLMKKAFNHVIHNRR